MNSRPGRGLAGALAMIALALALTPFAGRASATIDALASFLPLAIVPAGAALLLAYRYRQGLVIAISVLALLLVAIVVLPEWRAGSRSPAVSGTGTSRIVIVTHNLLRTNADPSGTLAALRRSDADILLLQEANGAVGRRLPELYDLYPYHGACGGKCDLAILSRLPIDRPRWRLRGPDGHPFGPPLQWTQVTDGPFAGMTIMTLHLHWPLPAREQANDRAKLIDALRSVDRSALLLTGDFNLTPWGAAMGKLDDGLAPMQRVTHGIASFPARIDGRAFPWPTLPIDQVFLGTRWRAERVERLPRTGSDHYPLRITVGRAAL